MYYVVSCSVVIDPFYKSSFHFFKALMSNVIHATHCGVRATDIVKKKPASYCLKSVRDKTRNIQKHPVPENVLP